MSTVACTLKGITFLREPILPTNDTGCCLVTLAVPSAYASGGDTLTCANLATSIQNVRRTGKTVTLRDVSAYAAGAQGGTTFHSNNWAVSGSGLISGHVANLAGSDTSAANGVIDQPLVLLVTFSES